jgi:hypothetical protein
MRKPPPSDTPTTYEIPYPLLHLTRVQQFSAPSLLGNFTVGFDTYLHKRGVRYSSGYGSKSLVTFFHGNLTDCATLATELCAHGKTFAPRGSTVLEAVE